METLVSDIRKRQRNFFPKLFPRKGMETLHTQSGCISLVFPKLFPRKGMETFLYTLSATGDLLL